MSITLDGSTGISAPLFDGPLDAADVAVALNASGSARSTLPVRG